MSTKRRSRLDPEKDTCRYALEADLTAHVKKWLDLQLDISYYKASDRTTIGVCDIIACVRGYYVGIELKANDGTPSIPQTEFIKSILRVGGIAGVCYSLSEVYDLVHAARCR